LPPTHIPQLAISEQLAFDTSLIVVAHQNHMFVKLYKWQEISYECKCITLIGLGSFGHRTLAKTKMQRVRELENNP
jgi:hypothetical protein